MYRLEKGRLAEEQRLKVERELELEQKDAAKQEANKVAKEEENRRLELLKHEQDQQDKLRQGLLQFYLNVYNSSPFHNSYNIVCTVITFFTKNI